MRFFCRAKLVPRVTAARRAKSSCGGIPRESGVTRARGSSGRIAADAIAETAVDVDDLTGAAAETADEEGLIVVVGAAAAVADITAGTAIMAIADTPLSDGHN